MAGLVGQLFLQRLNGLTKLLEAMIQRGIGWITRHFFANLLQ